MDEATANAWRHFVDERVGRIVKAAIARYDREVLAVALGTLLGETEERVEARMAITFESRFRDLEAELKAVRSELAVAKRLDRIETRMAEADAETLPPMPRQFRAVA